MATSKSHMKCCVVGCTAQHKSLHFLPAKENRRTEWLLFIFDGHVPATVGKNLVVCANHFKTDCFENLGQYTAGFAIKLRLKEGSVPTVRGKSQDETHASTSLQFPATREVGCQTDHPEILKRTVGTQLSLRTLQPHFRSEGIQATVSSKDCSVDTSTVPLTAPPPFLTSTPIKGPCLKEVEKEGELDLEGSTSVVASQGLDATYDPADSVTALTVSTDISDMASTPIHEVRKYIVYETCIMELFKVCPVCKHPCTIQTRQLGTFISVVQQCPHCEYRRTWDSQPLLNNTTPAGNVQLSVAVYVSGASFFKIQRVFRAMHLQVFLYDTFRRHARTYIEPAIVTKWKGFQDDMLLRLSRENAIIGGDMRADSPGHSAKFGSYTVMDLKTNTVIDVQLVQSNEVGGSYHMEMEGLKRSLALLKERKVTLDCIVTDRHLQIQKFLREAGINQYYDVWHVEKGISKRLEKISKRKDCQKLKKWMRAIRNHIYWTAATSASGPERVAKFTSILNHVRDVHIHEDSNFPACLHPVRKTRDKNKWLTAGTPAFYQLEKVLSGKRVLKDIAKLSPHHQTSSLESFHSVILQFAPKNVVFPFLGMLCR
nr:uncharacterized protein LOC129443335 [Misgurnus anguillicaudatus]